METFSSPEEMARALGDHVKWRRTREALQQAPRLPAGVAGSLGDSLTYWVQEVTAQPAFETHRRYLSVLHPLDGDVTIEVGAVADLTVADAYSDVTDRQHLSGSGRQRTLPAGSVGVLGPDEAYRLASGESIVVVRVTVEGASFHNK